MRRLSFVLLLAIVASLVPTPGGAAYAATFRTVVAQAPTGSPTSEQSVRVWMGSDTAFGETAGLEYKVGTSFVKVLGTYDTSGPASATWRADIPAFPSGTLVRYQLFTRNQSGQDYGFTDFQWSYTVDDGDIQWDAVRHDSFSADYRSPAGPVAAGTSVRLRLRVAQGDITAARVRVYDDRSNTPAYYPMSWDSVFDTSSTHDWWTATVPASASPTILYYFFEITDRLDQDFYVDDDPKFLGGGFGAMADAYDDSRSFQISVYSPGFTTPEWMQRAVIYQIFPDRFRDGDPANSPQAGRFSYGANVAIVRSNDPEGDWNSPVCDPRSKNNVAALNCDGRYGDNFYGGDLRGVTQKIEDGYFSSLGVTVLYLNPIFRAPSNHKYDTANFMEIDPDFGTLADFQALVAAANARGIRIMLDGVFNHTSSDSPYFDRYQRYNAAGQLTAPNGGANDGSGACEAVSSGYRSWFYFDADTQQTSIGNPGKDGGTKVYCADAAGNPTMLYEAWYGYSSLPKIRSGLQTVRDYFYGGRGAVGPYWTRMGASGWRFDVGADVDSGLTNDPTNTYWEGFRAAVRNPALIDKNKEEDRKTVMLGEEWGDGSPWLLGDEWDSVMNYRFRSAVLSWLFTGCSGNGCANGAKFQENDSNDSSSSGSIAYLKPSEFNARLRSIHEDYPANAFKAMMNLAGSHDTQRIRFLLKKINNDSDAAAVQRMKEWWLFAFTYGGAPTLYYGDEVGLSHDGVWDGSQYQDDPYNRAPFPWPDASGGAYVPDTANLQAFARQMASIRHSYRALQDGDVQHGLVIDDAKQLYGFARTTGSQTALVLLNRSDSAQQATFSGLNAAPYNLPDGAALLDAISGVSYTVAGGAVTVNVTSSWGAVLLEQSKIDAPAAAALSAAGRGADVVLSWPMVTGDAAGDPEVITRYEIFRDTVAGFTPSGDPRATVLNPAFGGDPSYTDAGAAAGGYVYIVRACNAGGRCTSSPAVAPAKQTATLTVLDAAGTYGDSVTLQATLSAGAAKLAGRTVSFTVNGASAGSAATNAQGAATLTFALDGIGASATPYVIAASFGGDAAYNPAGGSAGLTVTKATATLSLSGLSATYDGSAKAATVTTSPVGLSGVSVTYSGATTPPTNAGSYAVVASLNNPNYSAASITRTLVIARATAALSLSGLSTTYDGQPKPVGVSTSPAGLSGITVTYDGSPTPPTNAGDYDVAVTLDNPNYIGSASDRLTIAKGTATLSLSNLTQAYTGGARAVTVTSDPAGLSGITLTYDGSTAPPVDVGSYAVVASLSNPNYAAAPTENTLQVIVADQTISFAPLADKTYGDPAFTVSATASSGLPVSFSASGSCAVSGGTVTIAGAGSCTITASQAGGGNYGAAPAVARTFAIAKAPATIALGGLTHTYSGGPKSATATTSPAGLSGLSITYDGSTDAPVAAGSYAVVASLDNPNYAAADATGTLVIDPATATLSLSGLSATYDGSAKTVTVTTSPAGLSGVSVTYSGATTPPTNAGSYTAVASLNNPNYTASNATGTLVISKAAAAVTLADATVTYDGGSKTLAATTTPAGLAVSYTYDGSAAAPVNAGSYIVVATVSDTNYEGSDTATLTIAKAPATLSLSGLSATYDGSAKTVTVTTIPAGLSGVSIAYSQSGQAVSGPTNAGSYDVAVTLDNPNYSGSASGTLTIAKATAVVALGNLSQAYTGQPRAVTVTTSPAGLATTVTYDGSTTPPTNAGTYAVVATINNVNYQGSASGTLVVAKASQTVALSGVPGTAAIRSTFTASASASSGLPVTLSVSGACTIGSQTTKKGVTSATVTMTTGTTRCTVTATQAGSASYNSATTSQAVNRPPSAQGDAATTARATAVQISVLANDSDPDGDALSVVAVTKPKNGAAAIGASGVITYTPSARFTGTDTFTYTVSDGRGGSATATVTVTVR